MVAILPDNQGSIYADLERRVRDLENTPRVGLDRLRSAWQTAADVPTVFAVPGAEEAEFGTAGNTWANDLGASGTGYPTITMICPTRVQISWSGRPIAYASSGTHRTNACTVGVAIDGVVILSQPGTRRGFANTNTGFVSVPGGILTVRTLTPGTHTFAMWASWDNTVPAAPNLPRLTDSFLSILPLTTA